MCDHRQDHGPSHLTLNSLGAPPPLYKWHNARILSLHKNPTLVMSTLKLGMASYLLLFALAAADLMAGLALARHAPVAAISSVGEAPVVITPSPSVNEGSVKPGEAEAPVPYHHRNSKDWVGGDVILGGLATAIMAAIFCYIRVTRRKNDVGAEGDLAAKA